MNVHSHYSTADSVPHSEIRGLLTRERSSESSSSSGGGDTDSVFLQTGRRPSEPYPRSSGTWHEFRETAFSGTQMEPRRFSLIMGNDSIAERPLPLTPDERNAAAQRQNHLQQRQQLQRPQQQQQQYPPFNHPNPNPHRPHHPDTNQELSPPPYDNTDRLGNSRNQTPPPSYANENARHQVTPPTRVSRKSKARCCGNRASCVAIFAALSLSITAVGLSLYTFATYAYHRTNDYCLPCLALTHSSGDVSKTWGKDVTVKEVNGEKMCCISSSDDLSHLVTKVQRNEKMAVAADRNMTSAHVGLYAKKAKSDGRKVERYSHYSLYLSTTSSHVHLENVNSGPRSLVIVTTGWYFVYSSIHFDTKEYEKSCKDMDHKTWVQHVMLYRKQGPKRESDNTSPLLRSEHTCCINCEDYRTSSFTGGIFQLHSGDNILVDVSAPPLVVDDRESSYLGLFLVDDNRS